MRTSTAKIFALVLVAPLLAARTFAHIAAHVPKVQFTVESPKIERAVVFGDVPRCRIRDRDNELLTVILRT